MTNYIGRDLDKISNIEILDNITFDGSQSYTLQKGGVNFTPNSAQSIILGIDGITQIANFSVNGSTIDFGVAVANTSTCNYIIHLGTGLLTAVSDGSVTNAKLGTAPTLEAKGSGGTAGGVRYFCEQSSHHVTLRAGQHSGFSSGSFELKLPTAQGGANTFLKNDGSGNLSFASAGGSNTPNFYVYRSGNQSLSNATNTRINFNAETYDTANAFDSTGNHRFNPQTAGKYFLISSFFVGGSSADTEAAQIYIYKNGSNIFFYEMDNRGNTNGYNTSLTVSAIVEANGSSDYFEVYARVKGAGTKNLVSGAGNTWFQGYKIIE